MDKDANDFLTDPYTILECLDKVDFWLGFMEEGEEDNNFMAGLKRNDMGVFQTMRSSLKAFLWSYGLWLSMVVDKQMGEGMVWFSSDFTEGDTRGTDADNKHAEGKIIPIDLNRKKRKE